MIEERATVVSVSENEVLVAADRNSACGQCAAKSDCGQSAVAQWAASKMIDVSVNNPLNVPLAIGDSILVGIDEKSFIRASLLLYFVPLVAMFAAGFAVTLGGAAEGVVIIGSFAALLASFSAIKWYTSSMVQKSAYQLVVLKVVS